jgi:hypothetical protein
MVTYPATRLKPSVPFVLGGVSTRSSHRLVSPRCGKLPVAETAEMVPGPFGSCCKREDEMSAAGEENQR